jgi:predicted small lipoprotein YifL
MKTLLMAVVASMLLGGCGQRGPLYLPDQRPPKKRLSELQTPVRPNSPLVAVLPVSSDASLLTSRAVTSRAVLRSRIPALC